MMTNAEFNWHDVTGLPPARNYPAAVDLFQQGDAVEDPYLIEEGVVKLWALSPAGDQIAVDLRYKSWVVGLATSILGWQSPVTATTLTQARLRRVPSSVLLSLLKRDQDFSWYVHRLNAEEIMEHTTQIIDLKYLSARDRLLRLITKILRSSWGDQPGEENRLKLPLRGYEIAQLIGVTPEHLSRLLRQLEEKDLLRRRRGWLVIPNLEQLLSTLGLSHECGR